MMTDNLHVVHACAAGLDVHKMQITASIRICVPGGGTPQVETRTFEALASGLSEMVAWLRERAVDAAVMEGTGIYWVAPFEALEAAGILVALVNARQVKQLKGRKTDVADSVWAGAGLPVRSGQPQPCAAQGVPGDARAHPLPAYPDRPAQPGAQPHAEGPRPQRCTHRRRALGHLRHERAAGSRRIGRGARTGRHPGLAQPSCGAQDRAPRRCSQPLPRRGRPSDPV